MRVAGMHVQCPSMAVMGNFRPGSGVREKRDELPVNMNVGTTSTYNEKRPASELYRKYYTRHICEEQVFIRIIWKPQLPGGQSAVDDALAFRLISLDIHFYLVGFWIGLFYG